MLDLVKLGGKLNRLYLQVVGTPTSEDWRVHSKLSFRGVQQGAHLFCGVTDSTMSHGEGWHYIQLGRYVERTHNLTALIGAHFSRFAGPLDDAIEGDEYLEWVGLWQVASLGGASAVRPIQIVDWGYSDHFY